MKTIRRIFIDDVKQLFTSLFIIIIIIGITILPALYAWLNIYSNWDPYGNTAGLKIAFVSTDTGYKTDDGTVQNVGTEIHSTLRKNDAIHWVFLDTKEEAIEGVRKGDYYAALVVESDFTYRIYNFFKEGVKQPSLVFYQNQKKNPVATKISDTVVDTIRKQINQKLTGVIFEKVFARANDVSAEIKAEGGIEGIAADLKDLNGEISEYEKTIDTIIRGNEVLLSAINDGASEAAQVTAGLTSEQDALAGTASEITATDVTMASYSDNVNRTLELIERHLSDMSMTLRSGLISGDIASMTAASDKADKDADKLLSDVDALKKSIGQAYVPDVKKAIPPKEDIKKAAEAAEEATELLTDSAEAANEAAEKLSEAAASDKPGQAVDDAIAAADNAANAARAAAAAAKNVSDTYETLKETPFYDADTAARLKESADTAAAQSASLDRRVAELKQGRDADTEALKKLLNDTSATLKSTGQALTNAATYASKAGKALTYTYNHYSDLLAEVDEAQQQIADYYQAILDIKAAVRALDDGAASAAAIPPALQAEDDLSEQIDSVLKKIQTAEVAYERDIRPGVKAALVSLTDVVSNISDLMGSLSTTLAGMGDVMNAMSVSVTSAQDSLTKTAGLLTTISGRLDQGIEKIEAVENSDELAIVMNTLSGNPYSYADFFSEPVHMKDNVIYPVENYGSSVTPFYTTLAIWVGALILCAILTPKVKKGKYPDISEAGLFFGRYAIFFVLSQIQTLVTVLGNLFYFRIQCLHPFLFWLACAATSFTFSILIYALVLAFGDVGKAIAVVMVVIQIAGSSGTYPIELLPEFFQKVYLFFPFPYGINAMREAIGGLYGSDYVLYLVELSVFVAFSIVVGLYIRRPFRRLNAFMEHRMEDSGIF